jgi:hypothetical protein
MGEVNLDWRMNIREVNKGLALETATASASSLVRQNMGIASFHLA